MLPNKSKLSKKNKQLKQHLRMYQVKNKLMILLKP